VANTCPLPNVEQVSVQSTEIPGYQAFRKFAVSRLDSRLRGNDVESKPSSAIEIFSVSLT
jgi:hypothetical protein